MRFVAGFLLGAILALLPETSYFLRIIQLAIYPVALPQGLFVLVWGIAFGGTIEAANSVLKKEGPLGLLRIGILMGVFVALFWLISSTPLI